MWKKVLRAEVLHTEQSGQCLFYVMLTSGLKSQCFLLIHSTCHSCNVTKWRKPLLVTFWKSRTKFRHSSFLKKGPATCNLSHCWWLLLITVTFSFFPIIRWKPALMTGKKCFSLASLTQKRREGENEWAHYQKTCRNPTLDNGFGVRPPMGSYTSVFPASPHLRGVVHCFYPAPSSKVSAHTQTVSNKKHLIDIRDSYQLVKTWYFSKGKLVCILYKDHRKVKPGKFEVAPLPGV